MGQAGGDDRSALLNTPQLGRSRKHSVVIAGHPTSVSLEPAFWETLCGIARARGVSVARTITEIDRDRSENLSSAIRLYVLEWLRSRLRTAERNRRPEPSAT